MEREGAAIRAERAEAHRRPRRASGAPVRLEDVARQAGVSTASVSRALNTPNLVSPELRERIAQATQDLKWVPNGVAKALASLRTRTIGVMIPTLSHQNFATLIEALQQDLGAAQYTLILCCIDVSDELRLQQARKLVEHGRRIPGAGRRGAAGRIVRYAQVAERSDMSSPTPAVVTRRTHVSASTTTPHR